LWKMWLAAKKNRENQKKEMLDGLS
jgi:hypothetical protein